MPNPRICRRDLDRGAPFCGEKFALQIERALFYQENQTTKGKIQESQRTTQKEVHDRSKRNPKKPLR